MRRRAIAVVLVVLAPLAACGSDEDSGSPDAAQAATDRTAPGGEAAPEQASGTATTLSAVLAGPPGGDPDGSGTVYVGAADDNPDVCVDVRVTGVGRLTGVAIHQRPAGGGNLSAAPAVQLAPPQLSADGRGCTTADPALIEHLRTTPADFYVDVATSEFPVGALRGDLGQR